MSLEVITWKKFKKVQQESLITPEQIKEPTFEEIMTVGFNIKETDEWLYLAQTITDTSIDSVATIFKACIVNRSNITELLKDSKDFTAAVQESQEETKADTQSLKEKFIMYYTNPYMTIDQLRQKLNLTQKQYNVLLHKYWEDGSLNVKRTRAGFVEIIRSFSDDFKNATRNIKRVSKEDTKKNLKEQICKLYLTQKRTDDICRELHISRGTLFNIVHQCWQDGSIKVRRQCVREKNGGFRIEFNPLKEKKTSKSVKKSKKDKYENITKDTKTFNGIDLDALVVNIMNLIPAQDICKEQNFGLSTFYRLVRKLKEVGKLPDYKQQNEKALANAYKEQKLKEQAKIRFRQQPVYLENGFLQIADDYVYNGPYKEVNINKLLKYLCVFNKFDASQRLHLTEVQVHKILNHLMENIDGFSKKYEESQMLRLRYPKRTLLDSINEEEFIQAYRTMPISHLVDKFNCNRTVIDNMIKKLVKEKKIVSR